MHSLEQKKLKINHVMSNDVNSTIFNHILEHFKALSSETTHNVTVSPDPEADIYHFHRPNYASDIPPNSFATVHHDLLDNDKSLNLDLFLNAYSQCQFVVCLNSKQKDFLSKHGIGNTVVIPHGVHESFLNLPSTSRTPHEKIVLGFISKRYGRKVKGEEYLYELFTALSPDNYEFLFVGNNRSQEAWLARDYGFNAKVYERLPYKLFPELYLNIDILLITSKYEGGPASVPEAIASGTPIISTRVGMVNDYLSHGVNGYFLKGSIEEDISLFDSLADDRTALENLQSRAILKRSAIPTWLDVIQKHETLYKIAVQQLL